MTTRTSGVVRLLMALVVATACGSGPSTVATTNPTPATVLDDHFGFIAGNTVRVESSAKPLFVLPIPSDTAGVVSPDGRRLAYLADNQLHVINIASGAQPSALEGAMHLAWSSDSTGLVVGVTGTVAPVNEGRPSYTKLRVVDTAGGTPRDVISIANASVVPLAWDRQAHLISAYEATESGAGAYDVVSESGTLKRTSAGAANLYILSASQDGKHVFGHGDPNNVVRVWPMDSYEGGVELRGTSDEHVATVAWRPGTAEVYGKQDTSWLASWGPVQPGAAPSTARFVVVGMVEQAGTGATAAGPMLKRIWDGIFGVGQKPVLPGRAPETTIPHVVPTAPTKGSTR